jgi:cell division protein FtsW (lipid II flippase)
MKKVFYWLPRILSILFIGFISLFALDVFGQPQWFLALLIHLIPSYVLIAVTIIAWKHDLIGALGFFCLALLYVWMVGLNRHWSWYVGISVPAALVGFFYLLSWRQKKRKSH